GDNSADIDSAIASKIANQCCFAKDPKWFVLTALRWHDPRKGGTHSGHRRLCRLSSGSYCLRDFGRFPIQMASTLPYPSSRSPDQAPPKPRARKMRIAEETTQHKTPAGRSRGQFGGAASRCVLGV